MPITYNDIVNADLSGLKAASEAWKTMGSRFLKLQGSYQDHVKAAVDADSWRGESAAAYSRWGQATLDEYAEAEGEAQGVSGLLSDAYSILKKHKQNVEKTRDDAQKAGMAVDSNGRCTMDLRRVAELKGEATAEQYRRDHAARQTVEESWSDAIDKAVKATQRADENIKMALMAEPKQSSKGLPGGFNGNIKDDVGEANAARAGEVLKRLKNGDDVSAGDLRDARFLTRENGKDPEFSRTLINSLGGPEGLIKTHNRLDDLAYFDDKDQKKSYLSLDKGLATTLATATRNPNTEFYKRFRAGLQKAGVSAYDLDLATRGQGEGQKVRGYQSLVSLMKQGSGYSGQFLKDVAHDIRKAEDKKQGGHPDVWDLRGDFGDKKHARFASDPMDGILGIMSDNPKAAAEYLDPGPGGKNDNLQYLLTGRDWKNVDFSDSREAFYRESDPDMYNDSDKESTNARKGLGAAMTAAATGVSPSDSSPPVPSSHSDANNRVFVKALGELSAKGDDMPAALRGDMAKIMVNHGHEVHVAMS
ncbi:DUF6571 family protein, partial [Streptomyces boncukensis]